MIVNKQLLSEISNKMTYDQVLQFSMKNGYGMIPFGEYLLMQGIKVYAAIHGANEQVIASNLRAYSSPSITHTNNIIQVSEKPSCCGGGKVI